MPFDFSTKQTGFKKRKPAAAEAHQFIHFITDQSQRQRKSWEEIALLAGIDASTIKRWRFGRTEPTLRDIEKVLNVLGFNLVPIRKGDWQ